MEKAQALRKINEAFSKLDDACGSSSNWERYVSLHRTEEKGHRRFCPDHIKCGLTLEQSVRLFAVKEVFECITGEQFRPIPEDWFHVRPSIFAVWSIWKECGEHIRTTVSVEEAKAWLAAINYAELNKDPRELKTA